MSRVVIVETVRRHVTHAGYLVFLALIICAALVTSVFNRPASGWPSLVTLLALIAGTGVIGPEFSSGTLQLILVKPVNRAAYLLSRVTGVVLVVWLAAGVGAGSDLLGRALWAEGGVQARTIGMALLNSMTDIILVVALLALFGSLTRAYFNAAFYVLGMLGLTTSEVALALLRQLPNAVGRFLTQHTWIERGRQFLEHNLYPERPLRFDAAWSLLVLSNAAIALLLACLAFRRREVPYGAD
jgi:ABC-type transport system involved in multi-copper enzyme maturation permease subunit